MNTNTAKFSVDTTREEFWGNAQWAQLARAVNAAHAAADIVVAGGVIGVADDTAREAWEELVCATAAEGDAELDHLDWLSEPQAVRG